MLNIDENEIRLFTCYSSKLMKFLVKNNIRYRITGENIKTKKQFWTFIRTQKLNNLLTEWKISNPNQDN